MDKRYVVGLGEALWDVLPEGKKLGGAPANFAYHAGQFLGNDNAIAISALGEDKLAEETIEALEEHGLKYLMPRVPYPTGTVQVTLDEQGIPTYDIKENVAWDNIPFTPEIEEIAHNCRAVCYGSLALFGDSSSLTLLRMTICKEEGSPMPTPKIFESEYRFCQILWEREPVKSTELVKLCRERLGWSKATTYTVIKRLSERGVVKSEDAVVTSLVSRQEAENARIDELVEDTFGGSLPAFVAAFSRRQKLSAEEAAALRKMIEEAED